MKKCVIMPLLALDDGRGGLGESAYRFADKAAARGVEYWLLPSFGENYASAIDLALLRADGLVTDAELVKAERSAAAREAALKKAFSRRVKPERCGAGEYESFLKRVFDAQYRALCDYARSRGVVIVRALPQGVETVNI